MRQRHPDDCEISRMPWQERQARAFATARATSRAASSVIADSGALPTDDTPVTPAGSRAMRAPCWFNQKIMGEL
jgi:hypothetical protein